MSRVRVEDRWPVQPLLDHLAARLGPVLHRYRSTTEGATLTNIAALCGVHRKAVERWIEHGWLCTEHADRAAIAAGTHPALLWVDWYARALEGAERLAGAAS